MAVILTEKQIKEIADQMSSEFLAFYHKTTGELIFVPNLDEYDRVFETDWDADFEKLREDGVDYHEIKAMRSSDAYKVMEDFAAQVRDQFLKNKLIYALENKRPFHWFKSIIDNSSERENWFKYRDDCNMEWIKEQLEINSRMED
jgi:hypothetical protein